MDGFRFFIVILIMTAGASTDIQAHAFLHQAKPAVGSVVGEAPPAVHLWFSQAITAGTVRVVNPSGERVDHADVQIDTDEPNLLRVSLSPLGSGIYQVVWKVLTPDGHTTEGDFTFEVMAE